MLYCHCYLWKGCTAEFAGHKSTKPLDCHHNKDLHRTRAYHAIKEPTWKGIIYDFRLSSKDDTCRMLVTTILTSKVLGPCTYCTLLVHSNNRKKFPRRQPLHHSKIISSYRTFWTGSQATIAKFLIFIPNFSKETSKNWIFRKIKAEDQNDS